MEREYHTPHVSGALFQQVRVLLAEAQALSVRLASLNEVAVAMQSSPDAGAMLRVLAEQARWVLDFQHCGVTFHEAGMAYQALHGDPWDGPLPPHSVAVARVLRDGHPLLIDDLAPEEGGPPRMRSALLLPLRNGPHVFGTLHFYAHEPGCYNQTDLRVAASLALQVSAILQNARLLSDAQRSRDELYTVLDAIGDGVAVASTNGRIVLCNRALREMFGIEARDYLGRTALELLSAAPEGQQLLSKESVLAIWESIRAGRQPTQDEPPLLELSDGRTLAWSSAPLSSPSATTGYVVTLRDVTPQVKLARLRDEMVQMLVHDLRTPLTSILMGLDMLRFGMVSSQQEADEMLGTVSQAAHILMEQVNNLLDMRKLEAGQLELERLPVPVRELVDATLAPLLPLAQRNHQTVEVDLPPDLPPLEGDRALLRRVLENLLGNAFKFAPPRGHVRVSGRLLASGQVVELAVQDNGPGVPPELRTRIFEKYGQVPSSDARRGTGLGLAFAKLVIEAHQGRIGVRDAPGGGSIFWCRLMIARVV
ncbi:MAG: hypothetical protein OHK0022_36040 [Roseiflexaceae bacterium]